MDSERTRPRRSGPVRAVCTMLLIVFCTHLALFGLVTEYALLSLVDHGGQPDANIGLGFALLAYDGLGFPWPQTTRVPAPVAAVVNLLVHAAVGGGALFALLRGRTR